MIRKVVELDDKVFSAYIKRKSESLSGIIEHGMSVGYFDWEHAGDPVEVRSYVREILMNLVLIHAEVYAVSALIVPRVMHELVNILSKEFLECISEVEAFNVNGVIHVSKHNVLEEVIATIPFSLDPLKHCRPLYASFVKLESVVAESMVITALVITHEFDTF